MPDCGCWAPDHPATLATRNQIAAVLAAQGKAAEAQAEYRQVLAAQLGC